jgi:hypothetical protein
MRDKIKRAIKRWRLRKNPDALALNEALWAASDLREKQIAEATVHFAAKLKDATFGEAAIAFMMKEMETDRNAYDIQEFKNEAFKIEAFRRFQKIDFTRPLESVTDPSVQAAYEAFWSGHAANAAAYKLRLAEIDAEFNQKTSELSLKYLFDGKLP